MPPTTTSQMSLKRINREVADAAKEDLGAITLAPTDNLFVWKGSIPGPTGSPYEGGVFGVDVHLEKDYPCVLSSLPKQKFLLMAVLSCETGSQHPKLHLRRGYII
jgi:ubiquitin-protein ligase